MKTFDLKTIELEKLSITEQAEHLEYVLSLDTIEIYNYIFFVLSNKYILGEDESESNKAYVKFLKSKELAVYRESIRLNVNYEYNHPDPEKFPSKRHYLASNIEYLKEVIGDIHTDDTDYKEEIETLKKFEIEYKNL